MYPQNSIEVPFGYCSIGIAFEARDMTVESTLYRNVVMYASTRGLGFTRDFHGGLLNRCYCRCCVVVKVIRGAWNFDALLVRSLRGLFFRL